MMKIRVFKEIQEERVVVIDTSQFVFCIIACLILYPILGMLNCKPPVP